MASEAPMTCEKCSKRNATYHMTAIENNKKTESHLCEECAKGAGVGFKFGPSVSDLLGGLGKKSVGSGSGKKCASCGNTLAQIQQSGRVGCANDYEVFAEEMKAILQHIHGSTTHAGKVPGRPAPDRRMILDAELAKIKKELDVIVKAEKYEEAAKIRDRIKEIGVDLSKLS